MLNRVTRLHCFAICLTIFCLLLVFQFRGYPRSTISAAPSSSSNQIAPPPCKDGVSPGVLQITPDTNSEYRFRLARKRIYLSSSPFDLITNNVDPGKAPSRRSYYAGKASEQLIRWLEANNCETIYCRELIKEEVTCQSSDPTCVPEFISAYVAALRNLDGNGELARKWITNYSQLSSPELRTGFFEAKTAWLKAAVETLERSVGSGQSIKSTITDKDGIAFFYDLCPGAYYISTIAPIEIGGSRVYWESSKPITVEGPPDKNTPTLVTLGFAPANDKKKNFFVGKPVATQ